MGFLLYLAIIAIPFTKSSAAEHYGITMKTFFHDKNLFNSFVNAEVNSIDIDHEGWKLQTENTKYLGLEEAILDVVELNFVTKIKRIAFHTDIFVTYDYKSSGTLFSKPIVGEGIAEVQMNDIQINWNMPFNIIEIDGKKYIDLKDYDISYDIRGDVHFEYSNLYYGDEKLSESMHALINDNWEYITTEFGAIFYEEFGATIFEIFKEHALSRPIQDCLT